MSKNSSNPQARRSNIVVEELNNEVLLYDLDSDQASCLNETAALVWKYADGKTSVNEIAARMSKELKTPVDTRVVWYAVEQLNKKNLLQERVAVPATYGHMTRRDFLVKAGVVGAIVAIPVVISLAVPKPAMAALSCAGPCAAGTCTTNPLCGCTGINGTCFGF